MHVNDVTVEPHQLNKYRKQNGKHVPLWKIQLMLKKLYNYKISKGYLSEMFSGIVTMDTNIEAMISSILINDSKTCEKHVNDTSSCKSHLRGKKLPPFIPSMLISY